MKFDLELNQTGTLTSTGLTTLTDLFYNIEAGDVIAPIKWDSFALVNAAKANVGALDTSKFSNFSNLAASKLSSGVISASDFSICSKLRSRLMLTLLYNSGQFIFNKAAIKWSNNLTVKKILTDPLYKRHYAIIENDTSPSSISVATYRFDETGSMEPVRNYVYIPYSNMRVVFSNKDSFPKRGNLNSLFIDTDNMEVYETDKLTGSIVKILDITTLSDALPDNPEINDCNVTDSGDISVWNGSKWEDVVIKKLWRTSKENFKFTLKGVTLITNDDLELQTVSDICVATALSTKVVNAPEFPYKSPSITAIGVTSHFLESAIVVKNTNNSNTPIQLSYTPSPVITYQQDSKLKNIDVVYKNSNIYPMAIDFKNGVLCAHSSMYPSVEGADGSTLLIPANITVETSSNEMDLYTGVEISARLTTESGIPVKGARLGFSLNGAKGIQFMGQESGAAEATVLTDMYGRASSNLVVSSSKFGWYLDYKWFEGDTIKIPFDIGTTNPDDICLFFITADDAILGNSTVINSSWNNQKMYDYYLEEGRLDSYFISGRKIAFVELKQEAQPDLTNLVRSSFIKPTSIELLTSGTSTIDVKDAFIKGTSTSIFDTFNENEYSDITQPSLRTDNYGNWDYSLQPQNKIGWGSVVPTKQTNIRFSQVVEGEDRTISGNIVGAFLVIAGGQPSFTVTASWENPLYDLSLSTTSDPISVNNILESEHELILSDTFIAGENTTFGGVSYYSVSEFLENPFGRTACQYGCTYSDAVLNCCSNQDEHIRSFFTPLSNGKGCILTPEYYISNNNPDQATWCPGMNAQVVNPFVLFPTAGDPWTIISSVSPVGGGTISPSGTTIFSDPSATFTVTPTPATTYYINKVRLNGVEVDPDINGQYVIPAAPGSRTLVAYFAKPTTSVTCSVTSGIGTITPTFITPLTTNLAVGDTYTFNITASPGWIVQDVAVDGWSRGAVTSHTFINITAQPHTLTATFVPA